MPHRIARWLRKNTRCSLFPRFVLIRAYLPTLLTHYPRTCPPHAHYRNCHSSSISHATPSTLHHASRPESTEPSPAAAAIRPYCGIFASRGPLRPRGKTSTISIPYDIPHDIPPNPCRPMLPKSKNTLPSLHTSAHTCHYVIMSYHPSRS